MSSLMIGSWWFAMNLNACHSMDGFGASTNVHDCVSRIRGIWPYQAIILGAWNDDFAIEPFRLSIRGSPAEWISVPKDAPVMMAAHSPGPLKGPMGISIAIRNRTWFELVSHSILI